MCSLDGGTVRARARKHINPVAGLKRIPSHAIKSLSLGQKADQPSRGIETIAFLSTSSRELFYPAIAQVEVSSCKIPHPTEDSA